MNGQQAYSGYGKAACEQLGNAIILQAVKDYRAALKIYRKNPDNISANRDIVDVECFFHSRWFSVLTELDGDMFIRKLKEEVA